MHVSTSLTYVTRAVLLAFATASCADGSTDQLSFDDGGTSVGSTTEALYPVDEPPCPQHQQEECPELGQCEIRSLGKLGYVYWSSGSGEIGDWWCASDDGTAFSACSRASTVCRLWHDTSPGTPGQCDTI
jgi:hypothetical protein